MRLGVCSAAFTGRGVIGRAGKEARAITEASRAGFEAVELITLPNTDHFPKSVWLANKAAVRKSGITPTVHASFMDFNLGALSDKIRAISVQEMKKTIEYAAFVGSDVVTVHPGRVGMELVREQNIGMAKQSIAELLPEAERNNVTLCIENMESTRDQMFRTPKEFVSLFKTFKSPSLGMTLDLAHIAMNADAGINPKSPAIWAPLFRKVRHVHISGFRKGEGHTNVGLARNSYDYSYFYKRLLKKFDGAVVLELIDKKDALESAKIVRNAVA